MLLLDMVKLQQEDLNTNWLTVDWKCKHIALLKSITYHADPLYIVKLALKLKSETIHVCPLLQSPTRENVSKVSEK